MSFFEVSGLTAGYGVAEVLHGIDLHVERREAVAVLGPNGAGKSTLLNVLSGIVKARAGTWTLDGRSLRGLPPHEIVRSRLVQVPEGRQVFPEMSVKDNLQLGAFSRPDRNGERLARVLDIFPRLAERIKQEAQTLSGGEQQMLAIGRGLMADPELLVLDEPTLGLAPILVDEVLARLRDARDAFGLSILVVEQNAYLAAGLCDRYYLLIGGLIVQDGDSLPTDTAELMAAYTGSTVDPVHRTGELR
ncbi:MAG: branched-chain amino acid transport system ATP-binding protein livF [Pseudonocardiales bacterium]|jgi:branched-chain amino acid transport system ATP-binding protein|nr:branched-chain amino acid transport system ATP-binding protein livF [Pseudonocardiales bacterium]